MKDIVPVITKTPSKIQRARTSLRLLLVETTFIAGNQAYQSKSMMISSCS